MSHSWRCHMSMLALRARAVDVAGVRVEPDDGRSEQRVGLVGDRIEGDRAAADSRSARLSPALARISCWISGSGSVRARSAIELDEHDLGHGEPGGAREFSDDDFRDQHLGSLAGTAKLEHVHAGVVGFDDGRQRAALTQRRDVAGGVDGAELHSRVARHHATALRGSLVVPVEAMHQPMQQRREQQRRGDDEHQPGVQREDSREQLAAVASPADSPAPCRLTTWRHSGRRRARAGARSRDSRPFPRRSKRR